MMTHVGATRAAGVALRSSITAMGCAGGRADKEQAQIDAALRRALQASVRPAYVTADAEGTRLWKLTRELYENREFAPAWVASGDYTGTVPDEGTSAHYATDLVEAVKRFQRRHGMPDTGIVNAAVVTEMNVPIEERISQIQLNLERWRWLPRDLGERHILVNIPEYRLEVWEGDKVPVTMRTVVGKEDTPTPIFTDRMTHIVLSPYWNVPPSIAKGETLPAVLSDPGFLDRQNMEVLDESGKAVDPASIDLSDPTNYRFRQRPGASNALGLVKFMFPNQYDVYLHDTPSDSLFERASRSFSHGCVRLEQPMALAQYLLRDQPEWTRERLEEAMHAGEERHVKLKQPIPVYLGYWTARVSADGIMQFRKDIYGIDVRLKRLLADRLARLRRTAAAASGMP